MGLCPCVYSMCVKHFIYSLQRRGGIPSKGNNSNLITQREQATVRIHRHLSLKASLQAGGMLVFLCYYKSLYALRAMETVDARNIVINRKRREGETTFETKTNSCRRKLVLGILIHREIGTKRRLGQSVNTCSILSREPLSLRLKDRLFCQVSTQDKFHWTKAGDDKKRGFKKKCGCKCVSLPFPSSFPSFTAACSQKKETKMNKTKLKAIIV